MLEAQVKLGPEHLILRDRESRISKQIERFSFNNLISYAVVVEDSDDYLEPTSYKKAIECKNSIHLREEMDEEMRSLYKNNT